MVMRLGGMASGMDTETMITQIMKAERVKVNKYSQSKQIKVWTQEAYNDINKELANFILGTKKDLEVGLGGSVSSASWIKKSTSDENILKISTTASAISGSHAIKVNYLAKGVSAASSQSIANSDKTLEELLGAGAFKNDDGTDKNYSVIVNGVNVEFQKTDKLTDVASKINSKVKDLKTNFDTSSNRFFISTVATGENAKLSIKEVENSKGNGSELFTDILKINVTSSDLSTNPPSTLSGHLDITGLEYKGQDASIDFDGASDIKFNSNQFMMNGINFDLKTTGTSTVSISTNVDGVYDKIKGFVDKYNALIDKLNAKTSEKRYRDYLPLTDEQKKEMKEDDIKLWEGKSKSGLLRSNENINRIISNTRSGLYENVYSTYNADSDSTNDTKISGYSHLTNIGITTGEYKDKGKLKIDESKLKDAISKDVDSVVNLLFKTSNITEGEINAIDTKVPGGIEAKNAKINQRRLETGLINRLYDDIVVGMKDIINKSGTGDNASLYRDVKSNILIDFVTKNGSISLLDKDVTTIEKQISRENDRLTSVENRYWRKFTALEKAMTKMNSQSSWLASQLGGGQ